MNNNRNTIKQPNTGSRDYLGDITQRPSVTEITPRPTPDLSNIYTGTPQRGTTIGGPSGPNPTWGGGVGTLGGSSGGLLGGAGNTGSTGKNNRTEVTGVTTAEPWGPIQGNLLDIVGEGQRLYNSGQGQSYFPESTYAGLSDTQRSAIDYLRNVAQQGTPGLGDAFSALRGLTTGQDAIGTGAQFQDIYGRAQAPSQAETSLGGFASGANGLDASEYSALIARAQDPSVAAQYLTPTARGDFLGESNPYAAALYESGADDISNRLKSIYSGKGRYGSEVMQDALASSLGDYRNSIYLPLYESERGRQLSAAGTLGSLEQAGFGNTLAALSGRAGVQQQNIANRFGASSAIDAARNAALGQQLSATGAQTNIEAQNLANRLSAAGMMPSLDALRYRPGEVLASAGSLEQADKQAQRDADFQRYMYEQNAPLEALNWYSALTNQVAGQGGSQTTEEPEVPLWQKILGGIGTVAGIAGNFISDERLKEDMHKVGKTDQGHDIYTFRFKDSPTTMMGVKAQDVAKRDPKAVTKIPGGILTVDYSRIG